MMNWQRLSRAVLRGAAVWLFSQLLLQPIGTHLAVAFLSRWLDYEDCEMLAGINAWMISIALAILEFQWDLRRDA